MVRKSLISANNALILATVHLLNERAGLFEQKIELQMVTGGNSNFMR